MPAARCPAPVHALAWATLLLVLCPALPAGAQSRVPPRNLKIAFIGDQGFGADAEAVLALILAEGADAVVHSGDLDYDDDPAAWDDQINRILGENFPYFASVGNHDDGDFSEDDESGGYQQRMVARMNRLGIPWEGVLGVRSSLYYEGIFILLTAPGIFGNGDAEYAPYIRERLAEDTSIWRISSWHKNMRAMQVGGKSNETGWGVYEESRAGGAIVATGHEHSYSRTHLLASFELQEVASESDSLVLSQDDPVTADDEGRSFAFVSGLGGIGIRNQDRDGDWWASIYTSDQDATFGALFGEFHYRGNPRRARFYFKGIDGNVVDEFFVESTLGRTGPLAAKLRSCIDGMGSAFTRVAKDHGKRIQTCIVQHAGGKLVGSPSACLASDPKGRVAKAVARSEAVATKACSANPPAFGVSNAATSSSAAQQSGSGVIHHLFGADLDAALIPQNLDEPLSRCQSAVAGAALKCHDARLAAFQRCKKTGLRRGDIQSADELGACISQSAASGKLAKPCQGQLARTLARRCVATGASLSTAFPGCNTDDPDALAGCLREGIASHSCLAIGQADGLASALADYAQSCAAAEL